MQSTINQDQFKPTLGLALSGSGNRTSFYIGFLEVLSESHIKIDYITACSGGSLVAAAFACGTLTEFKKKVLALGKDFLKSYLTRSNTKGGLFSIDLVEAEMQNFTKGLNFEDVKPMMSFSAVDIESGEKVELCMGNIARAARISCTLPGIFDPVKWGGKTLVDGGLLTMLPGKVLREMGIDIMIGINMRGTKHIFTTPQITAKRIFNFLKKMLFMDEIESLVEGWFKQKEADSNHCPGFFQVLGKSLDLAVEASKKENEFEEKFDLIITPQIPKSKRNSLSSEAIEFFYEAGRSTALEYLPEIKKLILAKIAILEKVSAVKQFGNKDKSI
jgi:NTE family protein